MEREDGAGWAQGTRPAGPRLEAMGSPVVLSDLMHSWVLVLSSQRGPNGKTKLLPQQREKIKVTKSPPVGWILLGFRRRWERARAAAIAKSSAGCGHSRQEGAGEPAPGLAAWGILAQTHKR